MNLRTVLAILAASLVGLCGTGCIIVAGDDWSCCWLGSSVWTEAQTERLSIAPAGLRSLEVFTHNGAVTFEALPGGAGEPYVEVKKKTGGRSMDDAREAMENLEVFVEAVGEGTQRIGYRWNRPKRPHWSAKVSFDVHAPADVRFEAETHNGAVRVSGAAADVRTTTHNGEVNIASSGGELSAITHNGSIAVKYAGPELKLETHNGRVTANLDGCAAVRGDITTHNGEVEVVLGERTSARIDASTHNGGIKCGVPMDDSRSSKGQLSGKVGGGEGRLDISTHNGGVQIRNTAG